MKTFLLLLATALSLALPLPAQDRHAKPVCPPKMHYFPLSDVRLLDSDFKHLQELTHDYLLTLEPDRLCSWFRREAGLTPKAQPYPGWESNRDYIIPGHILGFYLSSMSMMYETTGDPAILQRLEYTLKELDECQQAGGDGYLSAVRNGRVVYQKVLSGDYHVDMPTLAGANEPTYIMNKITLGLYGVYTRCHLPLAKKILVGITDWFGHTMLDRMDDAAVQRMLICEHGSLSESFANVYEITGDRKYLAWAERLNDERMLAPAAEGRDVLTGWHANCQIQKFTGIESLYRFSGNTRYADAALFFWNTVVDEYSWVIGGNSTAEHFFKKEEADSRIMRNGGPESCNTVNMLRLTEGLYRDFARPEMIDFYERALLNHILAAYEPEQGMVAYMTKAQPGGFKTYGTKYDSFWCCTGTGFESPAKFQKMIYTHDDSALYVNLFIPSSLRWEEKGITLAQQTRIPDEERTELLVQTDNPQEFTLKIRHPYWVKEGEMKISVNGKALRTDSRPSGFCAVRRVWKTGDRIAVELPMHLRVEPLSPARKFVSVSYGPVVLAARWNSEDLQKSDYWHPADCGGTRSNIRHNFPLEDFPWLIGSSDEIARKIKKVSSSPLTFKTAGASFPGEYTLVPFNRIHFSRYVMYFPRTDAPEEVSRKIEARKKLEEATVDAVIFRYDASETGHKLEQINSGTWTEFGYNWRQAYDGGYFMCNLRSLPDEKQSLLLAFRADESGNKTFDILIDGKLLKTVDHNVPPADVSRPLYTETIPIPEELTQGKTSIAVKIQANSGNSTGEIYDLRLIKNIP